MKASEALHYSKLNSKLFQVEKYYRPKFEVFVRMPTFIFDTDQVIKAEVSSAYLYEKEAKGTIHLRWFAKKVSGFNFFSQK